MRDATCTYSGRGLALLTRIFLASSCSASLQLSLSFVQTISNFTLPQSEWLLLGVICHSHAIPCMALLILLGVLFPKCPSFAITTTQRLCTLLFPPLDPATWICFLSNFICFPDFAKHPKPKNTTPPITTKPKYNTKKMTLTTYESDFGDFDFVLWTP